ncbi:MAG: tRNA pseudouridine(55) synthase TruB [Bacteroidetes bacterium]|nr:tRNA pseudouridine(55) synthase TruB [Bacteroidota bacterium]MBV6460798.1 tRNA pseudouridine synthase B [Flavobacteriales bacterium]WKZ75799.1 MAG: tRNA pseudouridine(55) synthase TruB [Vicingaceae bacterium]MCL4816657.1 tRNA pseudouridine(55) synthase TruB [Flavobacteriales bacterium]NOG95700.1 tRNA pseudouridine(55) synthase TruB [Bacteroidota bacterium]
MFDFVNGETLLINKPVGWTSFDVVKKIRNLIKKHTALKKLKVGHAGTLDPLAEGLLIICTGKKTKEINQIQEQPKEYTGTFFLGATTPSYDLETQPNKTFPIKHITNELIYETARRFIGIQDQIPPVFSAKMIDGERAYHLARKGIETKMNPRSVQLFEFEITRIELPELDFRVKCSKGTYIRSLAFDFGNALNSGAYLKNLRRTQIGCYSISQAINPDDFALQLNTH